MVGCLALFPQPLAGQAGGDEVGAAAFQPELLAICLDFDALADRFEAESARDAIVQQFKM